MTFMDQINESLHFHVAVISHESGIIEELDGPYWTEEIAELAQQEVNKRINHTNFYTEIVRQTKTKTK